MCNALNSDVEDIQRQEILEIEQKLLELYEHISGAFGIQGLKAKLLSVLFISVGLPRSLTELSELTRFSKASVSRTMKELEIEIPFIVSVKKPQDKEKYYCIEIEFMDVVTGFLVKILQDEAKPTLNGTSEAISRLKKLHKKVKNEKILKKIDSFIERTQFVNRTYEKYIWMVERILHAIEEIEKEWVRSHPDE